MRIFVSLFTSFLVAEKLEVFQFASDTNSAETHFDFGVQLGQSFSHLVKKRLENRTILEEVLRPYYSTAEGLKTFNDFLETHEKVYPNYVQELRGMATGSDVAFEILFMMQIQEEYSHFATSSTHKASGCSDYMFCNDNGCFDGHNEDNDGHDLNAAFMVNATFGDVTFTAFTYAGELPTGGWGFNNYSLGFTLNWVGPTNMKYAGLGRGFVSRELLEAHTLDDAFRIITQTGQCGGHNYQLFDFKQVQIFNIETSPDLYSFKRISDPFFHANQYQSLHTPETFGNSSVHRLARVASLSVPNSAKEILSILGDQEDRSYPIFHDDLSHRRGELSDWTIVSILVDVSAGIFQVLDGNPKLFKVIQTFSV